MAARLLKVPIVLYESNSIPGRVTRFFSKYAAVTAITLGDREQRLRGTTAPASMPVRSGYLRSEEKHDEGCCYFDLDTTKATILVFGGSQGAKAINRKFRAAIETMAHVEDLQVLHFVGNNTDAEEYRSFYRERHIPSCVKAFELRMDLAWHVADFFISRAGAATIAEQETFEVPGILIPYPYALDGHQDANASYMTEEVGGSKTIYEEQCTPDALVGLIQSLLIEKDSMKEKIAAYKKNDTRQDLCDIVEGIANRR